MIPLDGTELLAGSGTAQAPQAETEHRPRPFVRSERRELCPGCLTRPALSHPLPTLPSEAAGVQRRLCEERSTEISAWKFSVQWRLTSLCPPASPPNPQKNLEAAGHPVLLPPGSLAARALGDQHVTDGQAPLFTDRSTEAQRGKGTDPGPHSNLGAELGPDPTSDDSGHTDHTSRVFSAHLSRWRTGGEGRERSGLRKG